MELLLGRFFAAFCVVLGVFWLIGWGLVFADWIKQKLSWKRKKTIVRLRKALQNGLWAIAAATILTGCCSTGNVVIEHDCPPMLRAATYQAMQADELADYRIAVEKCQ